MKKPLPIYTLDLETDPFKHGRFPVPFAVGIYAQGSFHSTWGENCIPQAREFVESLPSGIIYIHNGGRFDIFYLLDWIVPDNKLKREDSSNLFLINSRVVRAEMDCRDGKHEIRDSFAILPFPLKQYKKDDIDYCKLERDVRELHREEILHYLRGDCVYLSELVTAFMARFGDRLTIGSASMYELMQRHTFTNLDTCDDKSIRSQFYYGGRVQCFRKGIIDGSYKIYDVNSMYPYVMRDMKHPIGAPGWESTAVTKYTCFLTVEGKNYGAFPYREKDGGLRFDRENGTFNVTIHEWKTAIRHGLFEPRKIIRCINFDAQDSFKGFVDYFYNARIESKASGDLTHALFYKYVLNSAYGKFAQNPENYFQYQIVRSDVIPKGTEIDRFSDSSYLGWRPDLIPNEKYTVWKKPTLDYKRFNVSISASITGAARSVIMDALARADDPLYCDTDSIICKGIDGVDENATKLGAWKCEAEATRVCIAGKKLYAVFNGDQCVKQANKGVNITAEEIVRICQGEVITTQRDAPSFSLIGGDGGFNFGHNFITRKVRMR